MDNLKEYDTALKELETILDGIDKSEVEYDGGWWETFSGADFGNKKKEEIMTLFKKQWGIAYNKGVYNTRM